MFKRILLFLMLASPAAAQSAGTILVFGDSLSAAYGIPQQSGWVALLQQRLAAHRFDYRVVNASVSGETTSGGRSRLGAALDTYRPAIVILELGGNDGLRGLPIQTVHDNLEAMMSAARKHHAQPLLIGMRLPPNYGKTYTEKFQTVYRDLARRHDSPLVPFLLEGIAEKSELFQADRIHPLPEAQPAILENVWAVLRPMLSSRAAVR